jgi:N-acyl amino acid synthase of PEP-CTERM/exosortase system
MLNSSIDLDGLLHTGCPTQPLALHRAFKLRYEVYCLEHNFLPAADYPEGIERDEYDDDAAHFYAFDEHEELVGYVRLVRPKADQLFPMQRHCSIWSDAATLPARSEVAEVSRLIVRSDYRRRRGDRLSVGTAEQSSAVSVDDRRHAARQILRSLYLQMHAYSLKVGIHHWYAAMERPLARSLARSLLGKNFGFQPIGPQTDYYGPVAPYLASLRNMEEQVSERKPASTEWARGQHRHVGAVHHGGETSAMPLDAELARLAGGKSHRFPAELLRSRHQGDANGMV